MAAMTFEEFQNQALQQGFDEVLTREWSPGQVVGLHTHPFDVSARVARGTFLLKMGDTQRHLQAGDTFELARDTPHEEHYGPEGATFWAARRHPGS